MRLGLDLMNLKLNHIQHIGLPVTNLKTSEAFYQKLGFTNVMASGFDYHGARGSVAMMRRGSMIFELSKCPKHNSQKSALEQTATSTTSHLTWTTSTKLFAALKCAAFTIVEDVPVFLPFWNKGCKYFFILGPDGERLEFKPDSVNRSLAQTAAALLIKPAIGHSCLAVICCHLAHDSKSAQRSTLYLSTPKADTRTQNSNKCNRNGTSRRDQRPTPLNRHGLRRRVRRESAFRG